MGQGRKYSLLVTMGKVSRKKYLVGEIKILHKEFCGSFQKN